MKNRRSLLMLLILVGAGFAAGCSPKIKMVSRVGEGTATRTPFASKATYTNEVPPPQVTADEQTSTESMTATFTPGTLEGSSQSESTETFSPGPSAEATKTQSPQPGSATPDAKDPSATKERIESTATTKPPNPTNTLKPPPASVTSPPLTATLSPSASPMPSVAITLTATSAPTATSPPTFTPVPVGCTPSGNSSYENQVVNLINQEREDRGLSPLAQNSSLRAAARRHSEDMACNDFFSHTGSDGSTLASRILDAGYSYRWAAENIAASSSSSFSASSVVNMWMNSTGHRQNILSENAKDIGIGFRYAGDSDEGDFDAYYTADFGKQ